MESNLRGNMATLESVVRQCLFKKMTLGVMKCSSSADHGNLLRHPSFVFILSSFW